MYQSTQEQAPQKVSDFKCVLLNVTQGKITADQGIGILSSVTTIASGGTLSVQVPAGDQMLFQVLGIYTNESCPSSISKKDLLDQDKYKFVTELGRSIANVISDKELEVRSRFEATSARDIRSNKLISEVFVQADEESSAATASPTPSPTPTATASPSPTPTTPAVGAAPVRPSGTLASFVQLTPAMPVAHEHGAAVQVGSKIYLIGGSLGATYDGLNSGTTAGILEATIDSSGYPGAFTKSQYSLSVARKGARAEVIGSYIYIFGGYSGSGQTTGTPLNSIERANIDSNGLTSSFTAIAETLDQGRYNFLTLVTPNYVYAIGGGISSAYHSNTVSRATLNASTGVIGSFSLLTRQVVNGTTVTDGLVDNRWTHNMIRLGDNVYIMGGEGINTIEKVTIQSDGTLSNFVKLSDTLVANRNRLSIVALQGRAYVFGGWGGSFLTSVESAPIVNNELGTFSTEGSITLSNGVENGTSLLTTQGVYLFGGYNTNTKNFIQRAPIN